MSKPSYLDQAEEEQERIAGGASPAPSGHSKGIDLSGLAPKPVVRSPGLDEAVEEGRRRGFGPEPAATAPARSRTKVARGPKPTGAAGAGGSKRFIVSLDGGEPPADAQGQIALSGDAKLLYDFIRRAHYERKTRGELLGDMFALYVEKHGKTPQKF